MFSPERDTLVSPSAAFENVIMVLLSRFQFMMVLASFATVIISDSTGKRRVSSHSTREEEPKDTNYLSYDGRNSGKQGPSNIEMHKSRDSMNYQHLCATVSNTVHLNTRHEEFNPPFYVEKRCKKSLNSNSGSVVQSYTTRHFSRRKAGTHCWEPYSIEVPSGCECMWPVDEFGPIQRKEEL